MIVPLASLQNLFSVDMIVVGGVALFLFGKDLPTVAKKVGRYMAEFKRMANAATSEIRREMNDAAQDVEKAVKKDPPFTPPAAPESTVPKDVPPGIQPAPDTYTLAKPPAPGSVPSAVSPAAALDNVRIDVKPPTKIPPPV